MQDQKKFVIVIPSYKNAKYYFRNLTSALTQHYENYRIIYTDDCSPDNTGNLVKEFLEKHDKNGKTKLICNKERAGALANLYNMITSCEDDEIIITLDGDDWLAHPNVLSTLNKVYSENSIWLTYGQYRSYPDNRLGCSREIPVNIQKTNSYRKFRWCSSHLRSFYTWLFKKIKKEDLLGDDGKFYPMTWDLSMMFPMLEMAGTRHKFVSDVLYMYNYETPINDAKVNLQLQQGLEKKIRAKKPYEALSLNTRKPLGSPRG
jgi:glycosyltransferase involved in cell wall biosynthesis